MKCFKCHEEINLQFPEWQYQDWLKLYHYFEHELHEEEITQATFESMVDVLMTLKPKESGK